MSDFGSEKEAIRSLKARIEAQRDQFSQDLNKLRPGVAMIESSSEYISILRTAMPIIRPAAIAIAQKGISSRKGRKLIGIGILAGIGYGTWKLVSRSRNASQGQIQTSSSGH